MLDGLKRLFSGAPEAAGDWGAIASWCTARQCTFRAVHNEGFVIDGRTGPMPWRLEWGPSQRPYIKGGELRIRAELGLGADLQLVLMNRALQEKMEKDVFDQYVEGVQTRIDNQTPPEMRWLVMFPKLSGADMPLLRERFIALASIQPWLVQWLQGPLTPAIAALRLDAAVPLVLMIGRGRLMLRTALADADLVALQGWLRLFELAIREARRVAGDGGGPPTSSGPTSQWASSALPDEK